MTRVNSRALLIGCDFYATGPKTADINGICFPHLRGAVQDVNDVGRFLAKIHVPKDNIVKLTASYDPKFPSCPVENDESKLPTHANIIRELEYITENSEPGTLVYIQFSGHGIQRGRLPDAKVSSGGDTLFGAALATTNVLEEAGRYLTANELGMRIQAMVEKKALRVTLVLDACFSGRGLRNDMAYTIRTIPDCHDNRNLDDDKMAENAAREYIIGLSGTRQAEVTEDWLSKPIGCTVLTACGIQQTAGESTFKVIGDKTKVRRGVLTHWMLDLLSPCQPESFPSYIAVKEYVKNNINSTLHNTQQTPVLYGDAEYEFFGAERRIRRSNYPVIGAWDNMVRLDVGSAQGVVVGAVYDIYPKDIDLERTENYTPGREARIVEANDFNSVAELTFSNAEGDSGQSSVTEGSNGVLRTWALREKVLVKFSPDEASMKNLLQSELEKTPNLILHDELSGEEKFTVNIGQDNIFEIFEREGANTAYVKLQRLTIITVDTPHAIQKLAYVLQHISRYRDIEKLIDLPRTPYIQEEKFKIMFYRGSERLEADLTDGVETFKVIEGEKLGLRMVYTGPAQFVWVAIFELNASWGISRRFESKLVKDTLDPTKYSEPHGFRTRIPGKSSTSESDETSDTFMVFIVEGEDEKSWNDILLDDLPIDSTHLRTDSGLRYPFPLNKTIKRGSEWIVRQRKQERRWGVTSFIVHSSPVGKGTKN